MSQHRFARIGIVLAALGLNLASVAPNAIAATEAETAAATAPKGESVRPEVGMPLQAISDLIKAQKYTEAFAKLAEADAVTNKTPFEIYNIERMRGAVATASGNNEVAAKAIETVLASGKLPASENILFVQALVGIYFRAKDYPKTIIWLNQYAKSGGDNPKMRTLLIQTYYINNDFASAYKELQADVQAVEKTGKVPEEEQLQMMFNCTTQLKDKVASAGIVEKLVLYYPKKEYWQDLITRIQEMPGYSDRHLLDVYRLMLAIGQLQTPRSYLEMAELAKQAGQPVEAKKVMDMGYQNGVLGTGEEAARHKRLRDQINKAADEDIKSFVQGETIAVKSKDGTGLVNLGYAFVTAGDVDKGISLMEQGIRRGGLKRAEDSKLHMAVAYALAGRKAQAIQMFETVQGADGSAELARYWVLHLKYVKN